MTLTILTQLILGVIIVCVMIVAAVLLFVFNRKSKAKVIVVLKDFRNPALGPMKYYGIYDKGADTIRLYKTLISPGQASMTPPFDMRAYTHDGRVLCYRGVTGHMEDENLVPIHYAVVSQAAALETSKEIAAAIQNTQNFIAATSKFNIGDQVAYAYDTPRLLGGSEKHKIEGLISDVGYRGVSILYAEEVENKDKTKSIIQKVHNVVEMKELAKINVVKKAEQKGTPEDRLSKFFNAEWVMQNLGVIPVDDVNVVLSSEKSAVAQFNSKVNDRVLSKQGWFARNREAVVLVVTIISLAIAFSIMAYSTQSYVTHVLGTAPTGGGGGGNILGHVLPNNGIVG